MRILIVRLSAMGDLVQTLPALTDAAKAFPNIKFDWVVDEAFAQVPGWHSHVENVFPTAFRKWGRHRVHAFTSGEPRSFVKQLRKNNYDMIVDVQGGLKSAFAARLARGARSGYDRKGVHDWGAQFFYQRKFSVPKGGHSIQRMRRLLASALGYRFAEREIDYGIVRSKFGPLSFNAPQPYLVFVHSTSWASKIWPEHYWLELTRRAGEAGFHVILPWGDEGEQQRALRIASGHERAQVLPRMSISEKAAVINGAKGSVGLDTGLSHIAAALNVPSVTIYGATDPLLVGATGQRQLHLASNFECVRCHETECTYAGEAEFKPACLNEITPKRVWEGLQELLASE